MRNVITILVSTLLCFKTFGIEVNRIDGVVSITPGVDIHYFKNSEKYPLKLTNASEENLEVGLKVSYREGRDGKKHVIGSLTNDDYLKKLVFKLPPMGSETFDVHLDKDLFEPVSGVKITPYIIKRESKNPKTIQGAELLFINLSKTQDNLVFIVDVKKTKKSLDFYTTVKNSGKTLYFDYQIDHFITNSSGENLFSRKKSFDFKVLPPTATTKDRLKIKNKLPDGKYSYVVIFKCKKSQTIKIDKRDFTIDRGDVSFVKQDKEVKK